jgi:hypothetical protein
MISADPTPIDYGEFWFAFFISNFILSFSKLLMNHPAFIFITNLILPFGQQSYKKGYIINNSGDTIQGYIKEDLDENLLNLSIQGPVRYDQNVFGWRYQGI